MNKPNRTSDDSPGKCNQINGNPRKLPYDLLKSITNNFSKDKELGRGAFGQVFKGVLEDGEEVAVKMLRFMGNISDQQFENEFDILKKLRHPHIVRLVGFCDEAEEELVEYKGKLIVCQRIHRALCLEYMPKGSLGKLLSGENLGKNWPMRYKIIKGICKGLEYLREGLEFPIFHFDLKPDNILLNEEMMPKISDFGLSRLIGEENTKTTLTPLGTIGYLPPEFINYQVISKEYDIYSLGVIITKIITGITGYSDVADMGGQEFVEHVHENWKKYLQEIPMYSSFEVDCNQVKRCIEIARRCMENDRHKRPIIKDIVSQLDQMENFKLDSQLPTEKVSPSSLCKKRKKLKSRPIAYPLGDGWPRSAHAIGYVANQSFSMYPFDLPPYSFAWRQHQVFNFDYLGGLMPGQQNVSEALKQTAPEKQKRGDVHSDPPSEIFHAAHTEDKLELMTAVAPFLCVGCNEPGYGPRYTCGGGGQSLDLHTRCALAEDPVSDLHTLVLPLFGYGKQYEFIFLHEAPSSPADEEGRRRVCNACGDPTRGNVYHCSEQDLDLHPCCASLPDRFLQDGRGFDLHRRASRPCGLCPENEGQRRWFWAYRCYSDGDAIDLHVACLKETARRSWEACYRNRPDVGDGAQINADGMLEIENMFSSSIGFDKFGEIAGNLASFITALVFGNLDVKL